jgi:hypothetical protein
MMTFGLVAGVAAGGALSYVTFDTVTRLLSTSGIIGLLGLWWRRDIALRKISAGEAGDLRDHYAAELAEVRSQRLQDREEFLKIEKHLRDMISAADDRQVECDRDRRQMRKEIDGLHSELAGVRRQIPGLSADKVVLLGDPERAPHAVASAPRVKSIVESGGGK